MKVFAAIGMLSLLASCSTKSMHASREASAKDSTAAYTPRTSASSAPSATIYSGNRQPSPNDTRILRASQQYIVPGVTSRNKPYTEYRLTVLWKEPKEPNIILWRTRDQWIECTVKKKMSRDTLYLYGKDPVKYQVKISSPVANCLYFNNYIGDWKYIPGQVMKKLPDVKMN